jgi:excisionase family DNA binding protein
LLAQAERALGSLEAAFFVCNVQSLLPTIHTIKVLFSDRHTGFHVCTPPRVYERVRYMATAVEGGIVMEEEQGFVSMPLLTVSEAARYLGVGKKIVYQLIENGELLVVRGKGKTVQVEKQSLDRFRRSGKLT